MVVYYPVVNIPTRSQAVKLLFVETTRFTKRITAEGWEEDLRELQQELLANPEKGSVEGGTS